MITVITLPQIFSMMAELFSESELLLGSAGVVETWYDILKSEEESAYRSREKKVKNKSISEDENSRRA